MYKHCLLMQKKYNTLLLPVDLADQRLSTAGNATNFWSQTTIAAFVVCICQLPSTVCYCYSNNRPKATRKYYSTILKCQNRA